VDQLPPSDSPDGPDSPSDGPPGPPYRSDPTSSPSGPMPGPSVKLALIVVALAIVIIIAGLVIEGFGAPNPSLSSPASVATAKGSPLKAIPARSDLTPLISSGEPPDDIVNAVVLPAGSEAGAVIDNTLSAQGYDEQRLFTVGSPEQKIITFYEVELPALGWHVESKGNARDQPGFEVLAQRAGSDGYYWEIGAVVSPTTFPSSGPAQKTGLTQFEIRLFQVSDSD
jgi:hypothetical protein